MLRGNCSTVMTWTNSWGEQKTAVRLKINMETGPYIRLEYTAIDSEGDKTDYDYQVNLASTPCYFGGLRWWFVCRSCGRRAGVLYLPLWARLFKCRHCYNLTYQSCNVNRRGFGELGYVINRGEYLEDKRLSLKRYSYRGKPTKRYRRIMSRLARLGASSPLAEKLLDLS